MPAFVTIPTSDLAVSVDFWARDPGLVGVDFGVGASGVVVDDSVQERRAGPFVAFGLLAALPRPGTVDSCHSDAAVAHAAAEETPRNETD